MEITPGLFKTDVELPSGYSLKLFNGATYCLKMDQRLFNRINQRENDILKPKDPGVYVDY